MFELYKGFIIFIRLYFKNCLCKILILQIIKFRIGTIMDQKKFVISPYLTNVNIFPSTWISDSLDIIGNLTLLELTLPGSHNSAAYHLTNEIMQGEISKTNKILFTLGEILTNRVSSMTKAWSLTQSQNLYSQMQGGIRYFDIRAGWDSQSNQWVSHHFFKGLPIRRHLEEIKNYLNDYKREIVIIEISHIRGNPRHENFLALENIILGIFGELLYPVDQSFSFTVRQMIDTGQRVLLSCCMIFNSQVIWPEDTFYNTYPDSSKIGKMIEYNQNAIFDFVSERKRKLFKVSWILTPEINTVLKPVYPSSLKEMADLAALELPRFWQNIKEFECRMGNILLIDFYDCSKIIEIIWDMNNIIYWA